MIRNWLILTMWKKCDWFIWIVHSLNFKIFHSISLRFKMHVGLSPKSYLQLAHQSIWPFWAGALIRSSGWDISLELPPSICLIKPQQIPSPSCNHLFAFLAYSITVFLLQSTTSKELPFLALCNRFCSSIPHKRFSLNSNRLNSLNCNLDILPTMAVCIFHQTVYKHLESLKWKGNEVI